MISSEKIKNKNLNLIGISGKIGTGKDTICQIIQWLDCEEIRNDFPDINKYINICKKYGTPGLTSNGILVYDETYQNCKFAFKIKKVVSILTGIPMSDLENEDKKADYLPECWNIGSKKMTLREFIQKVGTDALKNIVHPNIWINALYSDFQPERKYIISDVRFLDEAKSVLDRNGLLIRVNRSDLKEYEYSHHISETQLDHFNKFDFVINNNGSIEDLLNQIKSIFYD